MPCSIGRSATSPPTVVGEKLEQHLLKAKQLLESEPS